MKHEDDLLKESQRALLTLMRNLPGMVYRCRNDREWTMEFVSDGCRSLTGYQPSHLIQNRKVSYGQLIHPEDKEHVWNEVQAALQEKRSFRITYRLNTATGERKWVYEQGTGVFSPQGNLIALEGFVTDVSERKQAEEELRLNESRLEALLKLNQMSVASMQEITDFALEEAIRLTKSKLGYLAFTNEDETVLTMYSWSKNAMEQCTINDKPLVYPLENMGLWGEAVRQRKPIITNDYATPNPLKKGYPKGHVKLTRHMNIPSFDGQRIVAVAGVGNKDEDYNESDIRQLTLLMQGMWRLIQSKRSNMALQESEERFRSLVENSLTGFSIIQDSQIVYQNTEQQKLLGPLPRSPKFEDIKSIYPDDMEKVKEFYQNITSKEFLTLDMDFRFFAQSKTNSKSDMKWVNCRAIKIEYRGKEAVLVNMTDITKTKEMEHLLRVQDKMTSLGRVAAGIAHEIRNPLSGINVYLNTLQNIYDNEESLEKVKRIIEQIQSASNRIKSVIKRVMDFSKPNTPKFSLIDINQPIEEAFKLSAVTIRKTGITIEKVLAENLPLCQADPHLIEEVILNLLTNATEALKNVGGPKCIEIASSVKDNHLVIIVADSGPGVSSNARGQIFDPFYTTKDGGTGIGLSISHRIITDHGGSLIVSVSKWGGAEFILELPVKKGINRE